MNAGESAAAESAAGDAADEEDAAESAAGDAADEEDAAESAAGDATDEEDAAAADTGGDIPMADATGTAGTEGLATLCAAAAADEHRARDAAETAAIDAAIAAGNNDMVRTLARRGVDEEEFLADVGELGGDLWSEVGRRHGEYTHTPPLSLPAADPHRPHVKPRLAFLPGRQRCPRRRRLAGPRRAGPRPR